MIDHNVLIVVADGRRANVFRNSGSVQAPHFDVLSAFEQENPASHLQGADKAGTTFSSSGAARSHFAAQDYHEAQERAFAKDIINTVGNIVNEHHDAKIIWVAPPRMLAELRHDMPHNLKAMTLREIDKDLTKHAPHEIIKLISN